MEKNFVKVFGLKSFDLIIKNKGFLACAQISTFNLLFKVQFKNYRYLISQSTLTFKFNHVNFINKKEYILQKKKKRYFSFLIVSLMFIFNLFIIILKMYKHSFKLQVLLFAWLRKRSILLSWQLMVCGTSTSSRNHQGHRKPYLK